MLVYEAEVAGPPKTLSLYNNDGGFTGREIIYGTSDGKVGLIELTHDEPVCFFFYYKNKYLGQSIK